VTPYRTLPVLLKGTPRSKLRTLWLRVLIRVKGPWRKRWVRCAVCRKGVLLYSAVHQRGGEPGDRFIESVLSHMLEFSCGHVLADHTAEVLKSRRVWPLRRKNAKAS